jgi:UDP-N-acetylmuramate--alanine ligase
VNYHFIGVGGIGMSALAGYLLGEGHSVSGSDLSENSYVKKLIKLGLNFNGKHSAANIHKKIDKVIVTSAVKSDNEELLAVQNANISIAKRGEFLAELIQGNNVIAISGSHGKTTTSGLVTHILSELKLSPSFILGGTYKNLDTHFKKGQSRLCVVEADESDKSFMYLDPKILSINNIDNDHLENYGSMEKLQETFLQFSQKTTSANQVVNINCSLVNAMFLKTQSFKVAFNNSKADLNILEKGVNNQGTKVEIHYQNKIYSALLSLWGQHNLENLAVALGCVLRCEQDISKILPHLATFQGMKRRMDKIGEFQKIPVFDDYAHHPSEVLALYKMTQNIFKNPLIIHQPHRYSRVQSCWREYIEVLRQIKNLELFDIYSAGELPIEDVTTQMILKTINSKKPPVFDINELTTGIEQYDAIVFCGAGNISDMARSWVNENSAM